MDLRIVALVLWGALLWTFVPGLLRAEGENFRGVPSPFVRQLNGVLQDTLGLSGGHGLEGTLGHRG